MSRAPANAAYAAIAAQFANGSLTAASPLASVKSIGPEIAARMTARGVNTIGDWVQAVSRRAPRPNVTTADLHAAMSYFAQNTRANRCVTASGPRVAAFVALNNNAAAPPALARFVRYHVPDLNQSGYNALLNLLRYARTNPRPPALAAFAYDIAPLPPVQELPRNSEAAYCGCLASRGVCDRFAVSCEWRTTQVAARNGRVSTRGLCVPRGRAAAGFRGRAEYRGQRGESRKPAGGASYIGQWRVPGAGLDPVVYPLAAYAPGGGGGGGGGGDGGGGGGGIGGGEEEESGEEKSENEEKEEAEEEREEKGESKERESKGERDGGEGEGEREDSKYGRGRDRAGSSGREGKYGDGGDEKRGGGVGAAAARNVYAEEEEEEEEGGEKKGREGKRSSPPRLQPSPEPARVAPRARRPPPPPPPRPAAADRNLRERLRPRGPESERDRRARLRSARNAR